jgi:hypothetical protein
MTLRRLKRALLCSAVIGATLFGFSCSLKSIGAGLLSEFLTSGGIDTLLESGLSSTLSSLLGTSDTTTTTE